VFEWDGWQGQFARARRWLDRLLAVANDWEAHDLDEQIDFALVFFQNVYHVRDYLLREGVVAQKSLDDLMGQAEVLRIARDLANGSKHRLVTSPSVDSSPWIHRSLNFGGTPRLTLKAGSELFDLVTVACACLDAWHAFLQSEGLDSASLSPARKAMAEALLRESNGPNAD
jgi:hypothetical protein